MATFDSIRKGKKMKVLLTGSNGQLGYAIRQESENIDFINTDIISTDGVSALDITQIDEVIKVVKATKPDIIINCSAHTNVDKCEEELDLAYKINAIGPKNLSIAATEVGAKIVHISTDYVFDGKASRPYIEFDSTNPVSAYGKTKLEGERYVKEFSNKFFIFRTAWLYGNGKNFVKTMLNLSNQKEISVVCDQLGTPTSAVELAKLICHFIKTDNYGLFHATCEGSTNWADFAEEIFRLAGKKTKVNHVTSKEYKELNPASANRPAYSILENYLLKLTSDYIMADWHDALEIYLKKVLQ